MTPQLARRSEPVARITMGTVKEERGVPRAARPNDEDVERFRGSKFKPVLAAGNAVLRAAAAAFRDGT